MSKQHFTSPHEWRARKSESEHKDSIEIPAPPVRDTPKAGLVCQQYPENEGYDAFVNKAARYLRAKRIKPKALHKLLSHLIYKVDHKVEYHTSERVLIAQICRTIADSPDLTQRVARSMGSILNDAKWPAIKLAKEMLRPRIKVLANSPNPPLHNEMATFFQKQGAWPGARSTLLEFLCKELRKMGRKDLIYDKNKK